VAVVEAGLGREFLIGFNPVEVEVEELVKVSAAGAGLSSPRSTFPTSSRRALDASAAPERRAV
jgi:hypothetical protein